jgi:hypothetical protein
VAIDAAATHAALARLEHEGSDLQQPLAIDFFVAVPSAAAGEIVADRARCVGFRTSVEHDVPTDTWTCYCSIVIVPALSTVVRIEEQLDKLAQDVGGYADGFGSYGNGP